MLAISRDGKRGYTANVGPGSVSVLDLDAKKTIAVIPISAKKTQRIALSADGKLAWTADQGEPRLAAIDTATNKIDHWIPLPAIGFSTAPTPDGKFLVVTSTAANKVFVVDLKTKSVAHTLDMPRIPQEVIVRHANTAGRAIVESVWPHYWPRSRFPARRGSVNLRRAVRCSSPTRPIARCPSSTRPRARPYGPCPMTAPPDTR
jgi:DNA-binding beta-propeller fold protein YncE